METERQLQYQLYLESDHWKELRNLVLERDGHKCTRCGSKNRLQVHHKFYRKLWEDSIPDDCITLCHKCHSREHGLSPLPKVNIHDLVTLGQARARRQITRSEFKQLKRHYLIVAPKSTPASMKLKRMYRELSKQMGKRRKNSRSARMAEDPMDMSF